MNNLGFMLAPQPCDIADAAEGLCELPGDGVPVPPPATPGGGQRPPAARPAAGDWATTAKAWALTHSTELLLGAAAVAILAVVAGGRRR